MNFNYKRNLVSRSTLASSFTGSIYTFKYSHLVEPGVEGQKLPHNQQGHHWNTIWGNKSIVIWAFVLLCNGINNHWSNWHKVKFLIYFPLLLYNIQKKYPWSYKIPWKYFHFHFFYNMTFNLHISKTLNKIVYQLHQEIHETILISKRIFKYEFLIFYLISCDEFKYVLVFESYNIKTNSMII